jgi:hypothetical protein
MAENDTEVLESMEQRAVTELAIGRVFATGKYKRGDVVMVADYYGPLQLVEMVSRQQ